MRNLPRSLAKYPDLVVNGLALNNRASKPRTTISSLRGRGLGLRTTNNDLFPEVEDWIVLWFNPAGSVVCAGGNVVAGERKFSIHFLKENKFC